MSGRQCPTCSTGKVLTGDQAAFNPRNEAGLQVCVTCKIQERMYGITNRKEE